MKTLSKPKLFLDFDCTIIDSIKAYCDVYNELFKHHPEFKQANWWQCEKYNLSDVCPLVKEPNDIFANKMFFEQCEFINDNTKDIIQKLSEEYKIVICSIGRPKNISYKVLWIEENLPFITNYVMITNDTCKMDKSIVDMNNAIFIDDVSANLFSSNAKYKICFGDIYEWNCDWQGKRCFNWTDIERLLL